jgi:hypothetical protein
MKVGIAKVQYLRNCRLSFNSMYTYEPTSANRLPPRDDSSKCNSSVSALMHVVDVCRRQSIGRE